MAYDLSFSPEFFLAEGEPYDRSEPCLDSQGRPASVWSAIEAKIGSEFWEDMARDVFGQPDGTFLNAEMVLDKVRETDTCSDLGVPVRVWIDAQVYYTINVWDDGK